MNYQKNLIELVNTIPQTVSSLSSLNLGVVRHKICHNDFIYDGNTSLTIKSAGWYFISVKADITSTVANQPMVIGLYVNGNLIPETETNLFEATAGSQGNASFTKIIKICQNDPAILTLRNGSSATTIYNDVIMDVIKIA